jgi:hypothetical protein
MARYIQPTHYALTLYKRNMVKMELQNKNLDSSELLRNFSLRGRNWLFNDAVPVTASNEI